MERARDLVIGMTFATLEGKLVRIRRHGGEERRGPRYGQADDRFVRHARGHRVGEFQARAHARGRAQLPAAVRRRGRAIAARNRILQSPLQPAAIDLLNPAAGASLGNQSWLLAIRAGGNAAAVDRYEHEFAPLADGVALEGAPHETLWTHIREFTPGLPGGESPMARWCAHRVR